MPGDGWGCQGYDLYNQQQHGEFEDSIGIRRNDSRAGEHSLGEEFSRLLLFTTTVYSDYVT